MRTRTTLLPALSLRPETGTLRQNHPGKLKWEMEKGQPRLSIRVSPMPPDWRITLVGVVDDRGREVRFHAGSDWGWSRSENVYGLELPKDAASVDCTWALHESRFVEFLARPDFVATAAAGATSGK